MATWTLQSFKQGSDAYCILYGGKDFPNDFNEGQITLRFILEAGRFCRKAFNPLLFISYWLLLNQIYSGNVLSLLKELAWFSSYFFLLSCNAHGVDIAFANCGIVLVVVKYSL